MIDYFDLRKIEVLSPLNVYTCTLNLGKLNLRFRKIIDLEGDKQYNLTNIKAVMTSYNLNDKYPELQSVTDAFFNIYMKIIEIDKNEFYQTILSYYGNNRKFVDIDIWGARYSSKEKTIPHDHRTLTSLMSMCLYLKTPKGCPGLSFTDISKTIPVKENQMILFGPDIRHSVKSKKFRGKRYVIAGNIDYNNTRLI